MRDPFHFFSDLFHTVPIIFHQLLDLQEPLEVLLLARSLCSPRTSLAAARRSIQSVFAVCCIWEIARSISLATNSAASESEAESLITITRSCREDPFSERTRFSDFSETTRSMSDISARILWSERASEGKREGAEESSADSSEDVPAELLEEECDRRRDRERRSDLQLLD